MADEHHIGDAIHVADAELHSVMGLAAMLVQAPSQAGCDPYEPVLKILEDWLSVRGLPTRRLHRGSELVGLVCTIDTGRPGPTWVLDACVDTAPIGDLTGWSFPPLAGDIVDGWLRGRGASDSKTGAAMFCHVATTVQQLVRTDPAMTGRLVLLFDADEHTGGFGGAHAFLDSAEGRDITGVMIGYPGPDHVVIGGRGVFRVLITVYGTAAHSGSSKPARANAISKGARLVTALETAVLPNEGGDGFPAPPKLTVTSFAAGDSFSMVPDRCVIGVDIRLTPTFTAEDAHKHLAHVVDQIDAELPGHPATSLEQVTHWPPYRLNHGQQPAAALLEAALQVGLKPQPRVAGPSNIGNMLAGLGIPATAGFGPIYEGLHGHDERILVSSVPPVHAAYLIAAYALLTLKDS